MSRCRIRFLPGEGCNPEFAPEKREQEGFECEGYFLLAFDENGELCSSLISGISIQMLADAIEKHPFEDNISAMRQGCAIAEGLIRASTIAHDTRMERAKREFLEKFPDGPIPLVRFPKKKIDRMKDGEWPGEEEEDED